MILGMLAIGWIIGDLLKEYDLVDMDSRTEIAMKKAEEIEKKKHKMFIVCMENGGWNLPGNDMKESCRAHAEKNYR